MKKFLTLLSLSLIVNSAVCQIDSLDRKFGEVNIEDLKMVEYDKDRSADALILLDKGKIGFDAKRNLVYLDYHAQIKIFNKEAFYLADLTLPYSISKGTKIEANTYRLVEGEVKKTVVSDIIQDKFSDDLFTKQITFPDVVEGVIIEYKYRVYGNSPFEFLPWYFQSLIPVRYSEFKVNIPAGFRLKPRLYGYKDLDVYQDNASDAWHDMRMIDVPAFVEEPYVKKIDDHYSKVTFEFENFFADDWEGLNKLILDAKGFGETIDKLNAIKKFFPSKEGLGPNEESIKRIHSLVGNHFEWNKTYALSFSDKPKKIWNQGIGSSADINLILLMFLKKAGISAYPVFLSTVENGLVNPDYVTYSQFNALTVYAEVQGKEYLLDATSNLRPFNVIPDNYINGNGLVVKEGEAEWVSMKLNNQVEIQSLTTDVLIDESDEVIRGRATINSIGPLAANTRIVLADVNESNFDESIEQLFDEMTVDSVEVSGLDDAYENVTTKFGYEIEDMIESIGDKLFFSPVVFKELEQNPFKLQERTLPIDFVMPMRNKYIFNIIIPEGFEIEELPKEVRYSINDNGGMYIYQIEKTNTGLRVLIRFSINKIFFSPQEYPSIREMFNLIISKQQEKVILVKKK